MYRILTFSLIALLYPIVCFGILGLGDIVLDPTNLVQTTLTAARTLESNTNEAIQIRNQLDSYLQQAKHLVALPMSAIDQVSSLYAQYTDVLNQGRGISYMLSSSLHQFESAYGNAMNGNVPIMQRAQQVMGQIRDAGRIVTQVSAIYERLCQQQGQVQRLLAASQAAPGTLAALQAQNQLMAVLTDQQASLQTMQAAAARVQTGFIMREITAEERAQWQSQQWLATYPTTGFRGPGQGQGPKLPD
jgi:P-type conjugative transfer protein TrbJ